jgi:hypothetical protein
MKTKNAFYNNRNFSKNTKIASGLNFEYNTSSQNLLL